jgi:hypothetical protein
MPNANAPSTLRCGSDCRTALLKRRAKRKSYQVGINRADTMTPILWVTGRAATGKTTVVRAVRAELETRGEETTYLCDEALLYQLKADDTDHLHHWHPHHDGRFEFRTGYLFDEGLRRINADLLSFLGRGSGLAVVELARGGGTSVVDLTYRRALTLVDAQVWSHSTVVRLHADFATQRARNQERIQRTGHGTPEPIMTSLYQNDDPQSLTTAGIPILDVPASGPTSAAAWILDRWPNRTQHVGVGASRTPR